MPVKPRKVLYLFGRERDTRWERYQHGEGPDEFMYGYNHFDPKHYEMNFLARDLTEWPWQRYIWEPFERLISWRIKMGFSLDFAFRHLSTLRQVDVIVSTVDAVGLAMAALKSMGFISTPIVYFSQGLSDRVQALRPNLLKHSIQRYYGHLLSQCDAIVVLGEGAVKPLQEQFSLQRLNVQSLPFGVDSQFWQPGSISQSYVLSVGSDRGRDYPTLLAALRGQEVKIVTQQTIPKADRWRALHVGTNYSDVELRRLYQGASCVIIPLKDVAQPSGQSATLQAMACGKAVILTKTQGLWEAEHMRHMDNCYLVPPAKPEAILEAVTYLKQHLEIARQIGERARATVLERYSSQHFAQAVTRVVEMTSDRKSGRRDR